MEDPLARFKSQKNNCSTRLIGLRTTWQVYRGPGKVSLSEYVIPVTDGTAETVARFSEPGLYTLVATAGDGKLNVFQRVTIDVK